MTAIKKVLVLGATGDQGLPLLDSLLAAGFAPTAGARRADALKDTRFAHLPVVNADIDDEESLVRAMDGQDALAMHLPFEFNRERAAGFGKRIGGAARRAGLGKIVFNTSCFVADHDLDLSAHDGRRDRAVADRGRVVDDAPEIRDGGDGAIGVREERAEHACVGGARRGRESGDARIARRGGCRRATGCRGGVEQGCRLEAQRQRVTERAVLGRGKLGRGEGREGWGRGWGE